MESIEKRLELTGKRIIAVPAGAAASTLSKSVPCEKWISKLWKSAVVCCASSTDRNSSDLMLYVEWDHLHWKDREWIAITDFAYVFVEDCGVLARHPTKKQLWPALAFVLLKGGSPSKSHTLIQLFACNHRAFVRSNDLLDVHKDTDMLRLPCMVAGNQVHEQVNKWLNLQKSQKLLLQNSYCLPGTRVLVYWPNSSLQWNSAVITGSDTDGILQVMFDEVLTQKTVDPRLTQIKLLDTNLISATCDNAAQQIRRSRRSTRHSSTSSPEVTIAKARTKQRLAKRKSCIARMDSSVTDPVTTPEVSTCSDTAATNTCESLQSSENRNESTSSVTSSNDQVADDDDNKSSAEQRREESADAAICETAAPESTPPLETKGDPSVLLPHSGPVEGIVETSETNSTETTPRGLPKTEHLGSQSDEEDTKNAATLLLSMSSNSNCVFNRLRDQNAQDSSPAPPSTSRTTEQSECSDQKPTDCDEPRDREGSSTSVASGAATATLNEGESSEPESDKDKQTADMQHSQHARTLTAMAAQQQAALLQQQQQQQQQQSQAQPGAHPAQQPLAQIPALPQQFLTHPYLNPYGLPFVSFNPALAGALNPTALAHQIQAMAAAGNGMLPPNLMAPWMTKSLQQDRLEKEIQLSQQQVLANYAALYRTNPEALAAAAYPAMYRPEGTLSGASSPKVATHPSHAESSPGKDHAQGKHHAELYKAEKQRRDAIASPSSSKASSVSKKPGQSQQPAKAPSRRQEPQDRSRLHPYTGRTASPHVPAELLEERDRLLRRQEEEKRQLEADQQRRMNRLEAETKQHIQEEMWKNKFLMKQQHHHHHHQQPTGPPARAEEKNIVPAAASEKRASNEASHSKSEPPAVSHSRPWLPDSRTDALSHAVLSKVDPATIISAHAAQFFSEGLVKVNGLPETSHAPSSASRNVSTPERMKQPNSTPVSGHYSVASKTWQPPVLSDPTRVKEEHHHHSDDQLKSSPKRAVPKKPAAPASTVPYPYSNYGQPLPAATQAQSFSHSSKVASNTSSPSVQSSVININSLKYSPSGHKLSSPKTTTTVNDEHKGGIHPDKIKSTAMYRDQKSSVKYITSRDVSHQPRRSPSPSERRGPLLADGTHARILSPQAMNSLYRFPSPSETRKTLSAKQQQQQNHVIINSGDFKVTEVRGNSVEPMSTTVTTTPSHVIYAKQSFPAKTEPVAEPVPKKEPQPVIQQFKTEAPHAEPTHKVARKRTGDEGETSSVQKKPCTDETPPFTKPPENHVKPLHHSLPPHVMRNLPPNAPHDRYLAELAAAGFFGMSGSNLVWGNSDSLDPRYPGAPSKHALKDALLGNMKREPPSVSQSVSSKPAPPEPTVAKPRLAHNSHPVSNGNRHLEEKHSPWPTSRTPADTPPPRGLKSEPQAPSPTPAPINLSSKPSDPPVVSEPPPPTKTEPDVNDKPKNLTVEPDTEAKPKTPSSTVAVSPSSDASSISDFSCSSSSSKVQQTSADPAVPPVVPAVTAASAPRPPTAPANCAKLKKAWLQRMSDESDDSPRSPVTKAVKRRNSGDLSNSPSPQSTAAETLSPKVVQDPIKPSDGEPLAPPPKKPKKKHRKQDKDKDREKKPKDPNKKKRKHKDKDKEGKRPKSSPEPVGSLSSDTSQPMDVQGGATKHGDHDGLKDDCNKRVKTPKAPCSISNSKKFLLGLLHSSKPASPGDKDMIEPGDKDADLASGTEGTDAKKNKKKNSSKKMKEPVEMPLGENGLPVSVLLCKKEQSRLKRSGESFIQDAACHEIAAILGLALQTSSNSVAPSLPKCRECRSVKRKENTTIFCRFYGFRKLTFVNGQLQAAGFCDPEDSNTQDLALWLPTYNDQLKSNSVVKSAEKPSLDFDTCKYIMSQIGGQFCELVHEEKEALSKVDKPEKICWKRPVSGVREMCDACETTLFNLHYVCPKCGFCVCCDCYNTRQAMTKEQLEAYDSDKNNMYRWLRCTKGKHHIPLHLMPTQIVPSTCLFDLCEMAHQARSKWNVASQCRCKKTTTSLLAARSVNPTPLFKNHCHNEMLSHSSSKAATNLMMGRNDGKAATPNRDNRFKGFDCDTSSSPLDWLASIALRDQRKSSAPAGGKQPSTGDEKAPREEKPKTENAAVNKALVPNHNSPPSSAQSLPNWFCNGTMPCLDDLKVTVDVDTFQINWFGGVPVVASGATQFLTKNLWTPEAICAQHGEEPTHNALVNCRKGSVITNAYIKDFWNGFECIENRLQDEKTGERMILKLKDWPTTEDFLDTMPDMFDDLMRALPLSDYTSRTGKYNIAAHLPEFFVRPDLGPKMYIAYGWVTEADWSQGTTNLHLDISDACNLMVYVGIPRDEPEGTDQTLLKIIEEGDVDAAQIERVKSHKPGALWHIFKASDTDKIRNMITKIKSESGDWVKDHDPIHDQNIYLDKKMRKRLLDEYGVEAYAIVQCEGDSVFIPAGAPHQVFNLHSCIKVAEDFVSPEHVDKCYKLMEEFRHLSSTHSNHEDKLQLKNIIYHAMKEVVSSLSWHGANGEADGGKAKNPGPSDG